MAEVRVAIAEANGELPDVCSCCGEPATLTKSKNMSWCPQWVGFLLLAGLLPYLIVMLIMTKRATVQIPFCDQHKGHWFNRNLVVGGTLVLFALIGLLAFLAAAVLDRGNEDLFGFACLGSFVLFLGWVVIAVIAQNTAIRPKEITDTEIVLTGVGAEFVEAVEDAYSERQRQRKRRRMRWDDDEDDEDDEPRPRRRTSPSDAIQEERRKRSDDDDELPRKRRRSTEDDDE